MLGSGQVAAHAAHSHESINIVGTGGDLAGGYYKGNGTTSAAKGAISVNFNAQVIPGAITSTTGSIETRPTNAAFWPRIHV